MTSVVGENQCSSFGLFLFFRSLQLANHCDVLRISWVCVVQAFNKESTLSTSRGFVMTEGDTLVAIIG